MGSMITNTGSLESGELGFGWGSITHAFKKAVVAPTKAVVKYTVVKPTKIAAKTTKWAAKKSIVEPTKIAAKGTVRVAKGSASVATHAARGDVTGAVKAAGRTALEPARTGYEQGKQIAKTGAEVAKAVKDIALYPVRTLLNTFKNRRAAKISYDKRGSTAPTVEEKAQARKDVKAYLSRQGAHGKMLAWLAGGPMFAGELGVVGYDDAALAAIATALAASLAKTMADAAKSKFAPKNAAEGATPVPTAEEVAPAPIPETAPEAAEQVVSEESYTAPEPTASPEPIFTPAAAPAPPVSYEEVAAEPAAEAAENNTAAEAVALWGALEDIGVVQGFMEAAPAAAAPEVMTSAMAAKLANSARKMICGMSAPAIAAIGGIEAVNVAGVFCQAAAAGDETALRATLPTAVQIASRRSGDIARALHSGIPVAGFGDSEDGMLGLDDVGMLAAFEGADFEGLQFGLAGITPDELAAVESSAEISALAFLPMGIAVLAGLWMLRH
jgi:hypothetical protein